MKLSDRLQLIANLISKGKTMADIGTDHGFLPLYLLEKKICPYVIMCDISEGSLQKAKNNFEECGYFEKKQMAYSFRLGNGIDVLDVEEVDTVCIAGMGGIMMTQILGNDLPKSHSIGEYILQPRNQVGYLRKWLSENQFVVVEEHLVREGKYICEILVVNNVNSIHFEIPPNFSDSYSEIKDDYLKMKLEKEIAKKTGIEQAEKLDIEKYNDILLRIGYIENLKERINEKRENL